MPLSRRRILEAAAVLPGLTLCPLLAPFVRRARAEAAGAPPPLRFVFVVKSSGLTPAELVPRDMAADWVRPGEQENWPAELKDAEQLVDVPLAGRRLHESLAALEPFASRLTIVQGLSGRMCRGGHSSWFGAMGCYRGGGEHDSGRIVGPTIDGILAQRLPGIFPHVGLALAGRLMGEGGVSDGVVYPGLSAIAPGRQLPYQATPLAAYKELFSVAATSADDLVENRLGGTLLDFLVDDVRRLEKRIGGVDRERLDAHLDGFESLRERRRRLTGVEAQVRRHAPEVDDKYASPVETDRVEAHFDLAAAALIAGLANVVAVRPDALGTVYGGLGIGTSVHGLGHGEGSEGLDPVVARRRIRAFQVGQIARLAAKLDAVPEGDGTMLDNTLIVYFSDAAEKHHSSCMQWPFLLLGGLGRRLRTGGCYLHYPAHGRRGHRTIATLYNTFANAAGLSQERLGQPDPNLDSDAQTGPLRELLA